MKSICSLLLLYLFFLPYLHPIHAQGLRFYGNEHRIAERSSLCVFQKEHALPACRQLFLSFEYNVQNIESPGYIFYLKDAESELAYNLTYVYNSQERTGNFMFAQDGKQIFHTVSLPIQDLHRHWRKISFRLDFATNQATLCIGNDSARIDDIGMAAKTDGQFTPRLFFGMYRHILETASFCLRRLHVECDGQRWDFPLNESTGTEVHDSHGIVTGQVNNPVWLINDAYHWKLLYRYYSLSPAGFAFSTSRQQGYIYNRDSLIVYDPLQHTAQGFPYDSPALPIRLGMCFYDEQDSCIYAYELNGAETYMARIDPDRRQWEAVNKGQHINLQMHHHGGVFDQHNKRILLFGGYGNRSYYNTFIGYELDENRWDTLAFKGPDIAPRFFTAMAMAPDGQHAYLYGGKGNEAGDQNVGIRYYYDLYRLDLTHQHIEKLWEQEAPAENRVPARDMIPTPDGQWLYLLAYPEYKPHTYLQLYRLSTADGRMEAVGDSIPMISEEIATNANLYYSARLHEFYCVVQEFGKYGDNETRIYALSDPPVTTETVHHYTSSVQRSSSGMWWIAIGIVVLIAGAAAGIGRTRRRGKFIPPAAPAASPCPSTPVTPSQDDKPLQATGDGKKEEDGPEEETAIPLSVPLSIPNHNALCLFGPFCIINRQGRDISYLFSPKIRHLFLYILINSVLKDGVLSADLNVLFWPDKPEDKIKNLKNVHINHLRKALQDIDGIELTHSQGYYRLELAEECYCDFQRLASLTHKLTQMPENAEDNEELTRLLSRGRFLDTIRTELFDYAKQQVETFAISFLEQQVSRQPSGPVLPLCKILQTWDPLSEVALSATVSTYRRRNQYDKALQTYTTFTAAYRQIMGEEYPVRFEETGLPAT